MDKRNELQAALTDIALRKADAHLPTGYAIYPEPDVRALVEALDEMTDPHDLTPIVLRSPGYRRACEALAKFKESTNG